MAFALLGALVWSASPTAAQLSGNNFRGDFGLKSGTQPDPHFYFVPVYTRYSSQSVRDSDGNERPLVQAKISVDVVAAFAWMVTDLRVLGANYGWMATVPWAGSSLEAPGLGVGVDHGLAFGDVYVQPVNLGWHRERADFMLGTGVYIPTGRWELGGDDNVGLGMWGFDVVAGTTLFLDRGRIFTVSALAAWETHTKKKDSEVKVGDMLTVEGGVGASFLGGGLSVGGAYFAQWKLTSDDLGIEALPNLAKARSYGLGPEAMIAVPFRNNLVATLTARYMWELGVRSSTQGRSFVALLTIPIPPIPL